MGPDIIIREMIEDDLRGVFLLRSRLYPATTDGNGDRLAERIADLYLRHPELCHVALRRKKLSGFIMGGIEGGTGKVELMSEEDGGHTGRIYGLLFDKLRAVLGELGVRVIYSELLPGNDERRDAYLALGFREEGCRTSFAYNVTDGD